MDRICLLAGRSCSNARVGQTQRYMGSQANPPFGEFDLLSGISDSGCERQY